MVSLKQDGIKIKKLFYPTKVKIRSLFKDGYSKDELYIMYSEYGMEQVNKALRGMK